jgi:hypothetical protein
MTKDARHPWQRPRAFGSIEIAKPDQGNAQVSSIHRAASRREDLSASAQAGRA